MKVVVWRVRWFCRLSWDQREEHSAVRLGSSREDSQEEGNEHNYTDECT